MSTQIDLGKVVGPPGPPGNMNLLDNWYFLDPVNQRGVSGTIETPGYFIDRWKLIDGSVTLTNYGLLLNGTISQILEISPTNGELVPSVLTLTGPSDISSYDKTTKTYSITANGETLVAAQLSLEETKEKPIDPDVWSSFIQSCGDYYELWDASAFTFSPFNDEVVKDVLLLRGDDSGTVLTASELFAGDPDAHDIIMQTMDAISMCDNGGDYIDGSSYALINPPTWYQFQYALIHRNGLPYLPDDEVCYAEAKNKYFWRFTENSESTEINLQPPNKTLELAKCQKYYLRTDFVFCNYVGDGVFTLLIPTPVTMKNDPIVKGCGYEWEVDGGDSSFSFLYSETGYVASNGVTVNMSTDVTDITVEGVGMKLLKRAGEGTIEISSEP